MRGIGLPGTTLVLGAFLAVAMLSPVATGPAGATFPGSNGKVAFTSNRDGNEEVYTMNADGSAQTRLTSVSGADTNPAFSSDGAKIAFTSSRQTPDGTVDREIWVMNADGSGTPTNFSNGPGANDQPDWAPLNFDLSLVQSDSPDPVKVNNNLAYTLELTNEGFDDAPGVVLTDRLPTGVTFVSASTGCSHAFGEVTCNLGTVPRGATVTKTVTVTPTSAGFITNTASVESTAEEITFLANNSDRERTKATPNRAPVANEDSYVTREDNPLVVPAPGVLADDADADADPLQLARVVEATSGGALASGRDGSFRYEPSSNFNGADAFTYSATDGTAESNVATVTIVVRAVNDPPEATDDAVQAVQDTPLDVDVLANDRDPDRDEMNVTGASDPAHGATTLGAGNTVRYIPDASYTGPDSFTCTVADPDGATDTATVNVTVSDTKAPTVVKPLPVGRNVLPTANVTALFSEPMAAETLFEAATGESATFVLKKGTVKVPATVSYNPGTLTAVLDPDARLRRGSTYTATVTTGAKDEAGTPLDQDPNTAGNLGMVWSFNIKP